MTEAELVAAIQEALAHNPHDEPNVFTVSDVVRSLGWSRNRVLHAIRLLIEANKASVVKSYRPDIVGRIQPVPAYRLHA